MTAGEVAGILASLAGLAGIAALWRVWHDRRAGISSNERQARRDEAEDRRDTIADRDSFIKTLLDWKAATEQRLAALETRDVDHVRRITVLSDHIDVLEHHIWRGKPPPPPPRPQGV